MTYKAKMQAKNVLREGRKHVLGGLSRCRNSAPFRGWNARHTDQMQAYFEALKTSRPHLSDATLRDTRIDQLNTALEQMKQDYS
jgi:hypothetical protein